MIAKISNISKCNSQHAVVFHGNPEKLGNQAIKIGKETADSLNKPSKTIGVLKSVYNNIKKACIFVFKSIFDLD